MSELYVNALAVLFQSHILMHVRDISHSVSILLFLFEMIILSVSEYHICQSQTDPTKLELMHKQYQVKKEEFKNIVRESVLDKYGGQEHLQAPPKELLMAQTEHYVEYSKFGTVVKGEYAHQIFVLASVVALARN
jgi:hypothetical protein